MVTMHKFVSWKVGDLKTLLWMYATACKTKWHSKASVLGVKVQDPNHETNIFPYCQILSHYVYN